MSEELEAKENQKAPNRTAFNYCVSFIDLLGQREAMRNQGLLPSLNSEDEKKAFYSVVKNSISAIDQLQTQAEVLLGPVPEERYKSEVRAKLSPKDQKTWDEMQVIGINTQRWSDGLVSFVCLGDEKVKCPINGVFHILALAGSTCLLGLAGQRPIRGAIDIAWGVELRPGELYGPAVACAYELESQFAQYPRIVVSSRVVQYLDAIRASPGEDPVSQYNRSLAETCRSMLLADLDGLVILHYLGEEFKKSVSQDQSIDLYTSARQFVLAQLGQHRKSGNSKLAFRYSVLALYFDKFSPLSIADPPK